MDIGIIFVGILVLVIVGGITISIKSDISDLEYRLKKDEERIREFSTQLNYSNWDLRRLEAFAGVYARDMQINLADELVKPVNPEHYKRNGLPECKDIIENLLDGYSEFLNEQEIFWLGNVIKYIYRSPLKNKREDLEKAAEYLSWIINEK